MALKTAYWFCDTYRSNVIFLWDGSIHDLNKWIDNNPEYEFAPQNPTEGLEGRASSGGNGYFVYLADMKRLPILHHECIHLVMEIFRQHGVRADEDNHEHLA